MGVLDAIQSKLRRDAPRPAVSAVISASVFDVRFLASTLPHIERQTRFAFAERVVVVDPEPRQGARKRERGDPAELDRLLDAAKAAGTIDRVVTLDASEIAFHAIHARYFADRSAADFDADRYIDATRNGDGCPALPAR